MSLSAPSHSPFAENCLLQRNSQIPTTEIDGEVIMMSVEHGQYIGLDAIASDIWRLLENPCTLTDLCNNLSARYTVDSTRCREDVEAFLSELMGADLLTCEPL